MATQAPWRNRIVRSGDAALSEIVANAANWRTHPRLQADALSAVISEVGLVQQVIINERSGRLVDGHLRVELATAHGEASVPAVWVDLSDDEERLILATLDPISAMAETNRDALGALLGDLAERDDALGEMLAALAAPPLDPEADDDEPQRSDGSLLALADVTIAEPVHAIARGEVWRLGPHLLCCMGVFDGWPTWAPLLDEGDLLLPFPGAFAALTAQPDGRRLVLVQPDPYIAGHIADRYAEQHGPAAVAPRAAP
jgi:hypothetical protein